MLQQTTVAAVIPYFHRFLEAFPDVSALAAADQADVLRLWEGLGYYSRARNLHRAAQILCERHGGELPRLPDAVHDLPGFGRYTVNAVLSQAFDLRLPILEANSVRFLCRVFGIDSDPKSPAVQKRLWQLAEDLLPRRRAGDFNQALMELGALICTPGQPRCLECPVAKECEAFRTGRTAEIPRKSPRPKPEEVLETAIVLRRQGRVFLVQRPAGGRWAEMWEFPRSVVAGTATVLSAAKELLCRLGFEAGKPREITTIRHGVTRFRITLVCQEAEWKKGEFRAGEYPRGEWLHPDQLSDVPVSRPQRTLATLVQTGR